MEKHKQKNKARRLLTSTDKHDRFISSYFKNKYPDIYAEAEEFYTCLDQIYPLKRDLRKTAEFLHMTNGVTTIQQQYYKNKCLKKTKENHSTDNMMLHIPLLNYDETSTHIRQQINAHTGETSTVTGISQESSGIPDVHADESSGIPDVHADESLSIPDVHADESLSIPDVHADESLSIPDKVYEDLIFELRKDPHLKAIFNDFESSEEDDIMQELIPHSDEETPLEWELHNLGY